MTLALSPTNPPSPGTLYRLLTLNDGEIVVEVLVKYREHYILRYPAA